MPALPSKALDTFPNPEPGRDYIIEIETPEFTCLCPKTGQPDFATLAIEYVPDRLCVELKSLKLYIWSYRNEGHFHEQVTNAILGDLVTALQPRWLQVRAAFYVRGGIYTTVTAEHRQPGWTPPPPPPGNLPREHQSARDAALPDSGGGAVEATGLPGRRPSARADRPPARARAGTGRTTGASGAEPPAPTRDVCLGVDLGTSACRVMALDRQGKVLALAEMPLAAATRARPEQLTQEPRDWWKAVLAGLKAVVAQVDARRVQRIGVAATPGTLLLCSDRGEPLTPGILHDDRRAQAEAERIAALAPESAAAQARSSLAKLLWLQRSKLLAGASLALHPADWIGGRLSGIYGRSDQHNALALGYDPVAGAWPAWLRALGVPQSLLPEIDEPGTRLGTLNPDVAAGLGLAPEVEVVAGTTDDVAAFLAAGAAEPGHGVTALGNVLVLKLLAQAPVVSAAHGVYSQRLGRFWLAGGASNSGGHVLLRYFSLEQMREMTAVLDPDQPTGLDYYPLTDVGERFPVADPRLEPQLEPLPGDTVQLFQGMLEGIARIEAQGYAVLAELGGPAVTTVWTTGGGSLNPAWTRIRARTLGVPLKAARSQQAAYGAALLAAGVVQQTFA